MSQVDYKEKTIGAHTFRVRMLEPFEANDVFMDLVQIMAPGLGSSVAAVAEADKGEISKLAETGEGAAAFAKGVKEGLVGVLERLNKAQVRALIKTMQKVTEVQVGDLWPELNDGQLRLCFQGKLTDLYAWLFFCIEVQFGDFIGKAKAAISRGLGLLKSMQARSESPLI